MKFLWAPWRIEYILSKKPEGCIFCDLPGEDRDRENLILYRSEKTFIIMNRFPYNSGHLMVVPYHHTSSFDGLDEDVLKEMMINTKLAVDCLHEVMRPEGFNTGINIGTAAGAGIEEHLHIHIVPRWGGDANFITSIAEIKVVPEHILHTYDKLKPVFDRNA